MNDEVHRPGRRRGSSPRWRPAVLLGCCGLGAFAAPAAAQPAEPPPWWLAESPGASGARFGLGLDYRFEDLDSLLAAALTATVTLRDPEGGSSTQVIPGDPGLNNRKFDYEVEVRSWGGQAPIALPQLGLGGRMTLFPSLVIEAATTEITFDFRDRTEPELSTSITGRGVSYGAGLETVGTFGREDKWFVGGGYRFWTLPDLDLERSPGFDPILDVVHDEIHLDQDTHLASLRVGRVFAGGRLTPWLGARGRWTELEIDDRLAFVSPNGVETDLRTRSRFESDSVLAVAGVDARLGDRLAGRVEVSYGDGDVAALLKVVYLVAPPAGAPPWTPRKVAERIAAEFDRISREFSLDAEALGPLRATDPGLYLSRALDLLEETERRAVEVLERERYLGLADWLRDRAEEARAGLQAGAPASPAAVRTPGPAVVLASLRAQADRPESDADGGRWVTALGRALRWIFVRAEERCLDLYLRFTIEGERVDGTSMTVRLRGDPTDPGILIAAGEDARRIRIGSYSYEIETPDRQPPTADCDARAARAGGQLPECPLDLVTDPVGLVHCDFIRPKYEKCFPRNAYGHCRDLRP